MKWALISFHSFTHRFILIRACTHCNFPPHCPRPCTYIACVPTSLSRVTPLCVGYRQPIHQCTVLLCNQTISKTQYSLHFPMFVTLIPINSVLPPNPITKYQLISDGNTITTAPSSPHILPIKTPLPST